jgi:serine/threonine-protein kinase
MTPERWAEVEALFDDVVDLPAAERDALLLTRCAHDPDLRAEVEKMLGDSERAEAMFEAPPLDVARALLTGDESDRDHVAPGQIIGSYRIVELLGRGGMGAVYLAERADGQFDKRVALKIVKRGMDTDEILARFRRERQILARLEHPNIAALYDGGMTPTGLPYFVMELVPGDPIDRWCDLRRASVDDRLRLFLTVCDAVQYAHRNLVVHRDLKPSNIVVCDGEPKLLDFGIAKMLADEDDEGLQVTRLFSRRLTPEYAAPEQVTGEATTTATDVYSLGVILYELLTGRSPYGDAAGSYTGIENALLQGDARPPSSIVARETAGTSREDVERIAGARDTRPELLRTRLAGDVDAIVCKALEQEPGRRYASADALADDIRRHLAGEPVVARPDTALYRWSKFVRRNRKTVALAGAAVAALTLGMIGTAWQAIEATRARDAEREAAERATAARNYVVGIFENLNPELNRGDTIFTRDEILSVGFADLKGLEGNPVLQATVVNTLAQLAYSMGDLVGADSLFRRAYDLLESQPDDLERAVAISGRGEILRQQFEFEEAERRFREALALRERALPADHPDRARSMIALAQLFYNKGTEESIAQADSLYGLVLERADALEGDIEGAAYEGLADIRFDQAERADGSLDRAKLAEAEAYYQAAAASYESALGPHHPAVAVARLALAYTLYREDSFDRAEAVGRQSLVVLRETYGSRHPRVLFANYIIGQTLYEARRFAEAVPYFVTAAEIASAVYPNGHRYTGDSWQYAGRARFEANDAAGAVESLRRAAVEYDRLGNGMTESDRALLHYWRGRAYARVGNWTESIHHLREAETLWDGNPGNRPQEADSIPAVLAAAYAAIGRPVSAGR